MIRAVVELANRRCWAGLVMIAGLAILLLIAGGTPRPDGVAQAQIDPQVTGAISYQYFPLVVRSYRPILFASNRTPMGKFAIYSINPFTRQVKQLTDGTANEFAPAWSPNGLQIAFVSDRNGDWEIYTMDSGGRNYRQITNSPGVDTDPAWSPDGTQLAFISERNGNFDIYTVNVSDGTGLAQLTNDPAGDRQPTWSPDGKRIAFTSNRSDGATEGYAADDEIYVMTAQGTGITRVTYSEGADYAPRWDWRSNRIVFVSERDGNPEVYAMTADGFAQTRLTQRDSSETQPAWSAGGLRIAFMTNRDDNAEIYIMDVLGRNLVNLTQNAATDWGPAWAP